MITQRSASLNKSILTQADVLFAMRTTGPQDRKAIEAWVEKQDVDGANDVVPSLPGLETGEAWIWNPERSLLDRVKIRLASTFDSSATPKAGEKRIEPRELAPIDLTKLGDQIEATAERAKENDPAELRKKLRELERELGLRPTLDEIRDARERITELERELATRDTERVEVPVLDEAQLDVLGGAIDQAYRIKEQIASLEKVLEPLHELVLASAEGGDGTERIETAVRAAPPGPSPAAARQVPARPSPPSAPKPRKPAQPTFTEGGIDQNISGPQRRILDALAALEAIGIPDAHKTQLALFAQASPKSSSFSNNLGHLNNQLGLISYPTPGRVALTDGGRAIADASAAPASTDELHRFIYALVGGAKARLLEQLVLAYPLELSKQALADLAGASATSSSFSNNLGSLRSLGLIDYPSPGFVAALPILFLEETM